jgi:hypothetical protein
MPWLGTRSAGLLAAIQQPRTGKPTGLAGIRGAFTARPLNPTPSASRKQHGYRAFRAASSEMTPTALPNALMMIPR